MKMHSVEGCYCDLFEGEGMPEGAICKPCFSNECECL